MKSTNNNGSIKPLNWKEPKFSEPVTKSTPHHARVDAFHRQGTPPTRIGMMNGVMPAVRPNPYVAELNPPLILKGGPGSGPQPGGGKKTPEYVPGMGYSDEFDKDELDDMDWDEGELDDVDRSLTMKSLDVLRKHKYVRKERGKDGNWRYYYKDTAGGKERPVTKDDNPYPGEGRKDPRWGLMRDVPEDEISYSKPTPEGRKAKYKEAYDKFKGGTKPGSMVGRTQSGKPVYAVSSYAESKEKHADFDADDHRDAAIIHTGIGDAASDTQTPAGYPSSLSASWHAAALPDVASANREIDAAYSEAFKSTTANATAYLRKSMLPQVPLRPQQPQGAAPGMPQTPGASSPPGMQPGLPQSGAPGMQGAAPKPPMQPQGQQQGQQPQAPQQQPGMMQRPQPQMGQPGMMQQPRPQMGMQQQMQPQMGMQPQMQPAPGMPQMPQPMAAGQAAMMPGMGPQLAQPQAPMAMAPTGAPIMPDPFNPAHQQFGPQDHASAAQAQQSAGNPMAAQVHQNKAEDAKSPMERAAGKFGQSAPESKGTQQPYGIKGDGQSQEQSKPPGSEANDDDPAERNGPKPGMSERPPEKGDDEGSESTPAEGDKSSMTGAMEQWMAKQKGEGDTAPTPGSSKQQLGQGMPEKQVGSKAPPTNAGSRNTPIERTVQKSILDTFGW